MSWIASNKGHACLWMFETWHHQQRDVGFDEVKDWTCTYIIKSAAGDSEAMRASKAQAHAILLDGAFTSLYRAAYMVGMDKDSAVAAMEAVLRDGSKTMADLADVVDACYVFRGEAAS